MPDARVFFTGSGSESIDTAMKLARIAHVQAGEGHRKLIISRVRGYHGTAYGGTSAQGIAPNRQDFGPFVDEVVQVPADDVEALASLMAERGNEVAAVIVEPVQGAGGIYPADRRLPRGRAPAVRPARRVPGVRRGHHRLRPAGHVVRQPPLRRRGPTSSRSPRPSPSATSRSAACSSGPAPAAALERDPDFFLRHGFTYSGHATACAAALKNLEIMQREGLVERATHVGDRLAAGLRALADDGTIDHVRGLGGDVGRRPARRPERDVACATTCSTTAASCAER